tara:strand:- start:705 stop:4145 length:3441 start_codon:yes stop_codon:yes gene_type:complete
MSSNNGNIQGGPFLDWVTNQIYERQLSLGRGSGGSPKDVLYQQSKTPYLRLASSVNFKKKTGSVGILDRLNTLPDFDATNFEGDIAAKNFILQGGALSLNEDNSITQNSGLNIGADLNNQLKGAYGWGGTTERGFIPMPGITGASVKYENDGALTKTTVNIKCYSKTQLALVDALYMRPGYTLLLEFGWSAYLKTNEGGDMLKSPVKENDVDPVKLVNTESFKTLPLSYLLDGGSGKNQYTIVQKIKVERERQSGNYEAVFGKIVNFKWSLNDDGSYDCEVHLRGLGEVIESLKMNTNTTTEEGQIPPPDPNVELEEEDDKSEEIPLISNAKKTALNTCLYAIYQGARKATGYKQFSEDLTPPPPNETNYQKLKRLAENAIRNNPITKAASQAAANYAGINLDTVGDDIVQDYSINNFPRLTTSGTYVKNGINVKRGIIALTNTTTQTDNYSPQVYITFGLLLALIQKNVILKNGQRGAPFFMFDLNFGSLQSDKTLIRRMPGQFSCNPLNFLIPGTPHGLSNVPQFPNFQNDTNPAPFNDFITQNGANWRYGSEPYLARLANVYINTSYIANTIDGLPMTLNDLQRNEKNSLDFLNTILKDMNISLGGINSVKMVVPDEGGLVRFTENIPQQFNGDPFPRADYCKFNTFGFSRGTPNNTAGSLLNDQRQGSIVRNIGIDASIPSNFSTMISIGSQNNGNQANGNATSFSNYNNGIIDRVIPQKVVENAKVTTPEGDGDAKSQQELMTEIVEDLTTSNFLAEKTKGKRIDLSGGIYRDIYLQRQWYGSDLETFTEIASTYHQFLSGILSQPVSSGGTGQLKAPFFLPFNLSLEMDGISGIVMMQRFEIDQKILPPSYDKDSVELVIKTVDHEITLSSWVTKLGTYSVPIYNTNKSQYIADNTSNSSNSPSNANPTDTNTPSVAEEVVVNTEPNPDVALLRLRLTRLYDDGNQTLGILDILAEDESTVRFSLPTVEQSFKDNQNRLSCVPQDRYLMGKSNGGGYGPHFQLYANEKNSYSPQELKDGDGSNVRTDIFIIPRWNYSQLQGSIGVGLTYNTLTNQAVNSSETGLGPSVNASQAATPSADALKQILSQLGNLNEFFLDIEGTPNNNKDSFIDTAKSYYFWENPDTSGPDLVGGEELPSNYA